MLKLLVKMRNSPLDWDIKQLETVVKRFGINIRKPGGSHVVFEHPQWVEMLSVPARSIRKPKR